MARRPRPTSGPSRASKATRASRAASLRPIATPRALVVHADADGMPLAVARADARGRRRGQVRVESIEEVWRVIEAWWREAPQARTYFRVILEGGSPLTCFRDESADAWFEQPYSEPRTTGDVTREGAR